MRVRPQSEQLSPATALMSPPANAARSDSEVIGHQHPKKKRTTKQLVKTTRRVVVPKFLLADTEGEPANEEEEVEDEDETGEEAVDKEENEEEKKELQRQLLEPRGSLDAEDATRPKGKPSPIAMGSSPENTGPLAATAVGPEKAARPMVYIVLICQICVVLYTRI